MPSCAQHPAGLGAGVVELAGLPDHDRPGPDDQDRVQVLTPRHAPLRPGRPAASISAQNSSNRPAASCGPGAASGWYCTLNAGRVQQPQALDHAVVEVDVGDLRPGRIRVSKGAARAAAAPGGGSAGPGHGHREAVVVAGDVHLAGAQVLDRLVHPAVPEAQLVGAQAERPAEDLAAQADAEDRDARPRARRARRRPRSRARPGRRARWRRTRRPGRAGRGSPRRWPWRAAPATSAAEPGQARGVAVLMPRSTAATR